MAVYLSRLEEGRSLRGQVLSLLRTQGALPRIELARKTGLSPTSITRAVNQLIDDGLVVEGSTISPTRLGRPATQVALVPGSAWVVGIQIGVGIVQLGLVDLLGTVGATMQFEYPAEASGEDAVTMAGEAAKALLEEFPEREKVVGIGVSAPGPVDEEGRNLLLPINLSWRNTPVADLLEAMLGYQLVVEHNARSMALAESLFGSAREIGSVAFIYLGTGIGAGLVVEGQPFSGGVRGAVELGHVRVRDDGLACICGSKGCLETIVSRGALNASVAALGLEASGNPLVDLWQAAKTEPKAAVEIDYIVKHLAIALSSLTILLNPEALILGGLFAALDESFFDRLREETVEAVFPLLRPSVQIRATSFPEIEGILGGGATALEHFLYL